MVPHWELFPHEADVGVRGYGGSLEEAFEQTGLALTAAIIDPGAIRPLIPVPILLEAPDPELLLVDWLNALIFEMATRKLLFSRHEVTIKGRELRATVWGEPVDSGRHELAVEVKGATYTALRVAKEADGWVAQCVVDV